MLPVGAGASDPKPLLSPPPLFVVDEKLNPEAEPNPDVAAGLSEVGTAKEKAEAEGGEVTVEEEPNPEGGCVGAVRALPKPVGAEGADPKPPLGAAKPKPLVCAGAGAPKPVWSERF